ncbi:ABC transporter ATP-binding protein [Rhizobiales bacterium TNE-4]|nr:ABC transporter ATP-binding protein [Rhizobiales bacterium TNE-4]MBV1828923.1 ABC transporter ATP-binding protein [Rhizobiales bacterium TNE-4]
MTKPSLVQITNLSVSLPKGGDRPFAIENVSMAVGHGEIVCVVGESGSGKSVAASTLMGLLPRGLAIAAGQAIVNGEDVAHMTPERLRALRGREVAMIFQEPLSALNPLMKIGAQMTELFEAHKAYPGRAGRERILELFDYVGLPDPARLIESYPYQLSGGQRQRVVIAMALALHPKLILADEPTTALDVTTQAQVLELLRKIRREHGTSILFVTHDFGVVADIADRVIVMEKGRLIEEGPVDQVLRAPREPYTQKLVAAVPSLRPAFLPPPEDEIVLSVAHVNKTYGRSGGWFSRGHAVKAVDDVNFTVRRGETVGIIGESGSGKSTTGRLIVRLVDPDSGEIALHGKDIAHLPREIFRKKRKVLQMIFQDPLSSLNPRKRIRTILTDGPVAHGINRAEAEKRAKALLEYVGFSEAALDRFPHEFSGGQRQRIGIARALMLDPEVIIADEPVSALDVSVQAQVLELINNLQREMKLALVFITHDLRVAAQLCHRIAVMHRGKIVEYGETAKIFADPQHAYTRQLLAAIPGRHIEEQRH